MECPTSTFDLLVRIRAGEQALLSDLLGRYQKRLSLVLSYKVGVRLREAISVQDLLQETLIRAYRDVGTFSYEGPGSFMKWLDAIGDHVVVDQARRLGRRKRKGEMLRFRSESNPGGPEPGTSLSPGRVLEAREEIERFKRSLDALPDDYRQVVFLSRVLGCRVAEIAERMGKTAPQVSVMLHRAIGRLRRLLQQEGR